MKEIILVRHAWPGQHIDRQFNVRQDSRFNHPDTHFNAIVHWCMDRERHPDLFFLICEPVQIRTSDRKEVLDSTGYPIMRVKHYERVAVIKVRGNLTGGEETMEVRRQVKKVLAGEVYDLIFDLSGVKWMNSHGLGTLMACYASVEREGGRLGIAGMSGKVHNILSITRVIRLFEQFDSVQQGVKTFKANQLKRTEGKRTPTGE
jgi:anti-sigma B factor antagonist